MGQVAVVEEVVVEEEVVGVVEAGVASSRRRYTPGRSHQDILEDRD